jgi:hypothetical protein
MVRLAPEPALPAPEREETRKDFSTWLLISKPRPGRFSEA